jgi:putative DeoR family transcriptional regulator, stage III sporulation protein D
MLTQTDFYFILICRTSDKYLKVAEKIKKGVTWLKKIDLWIQERCIDIGDYMILTGATVRQCSRVFGISKSTVYKDVAERLPNIDRSKAKWAADVMSKNKAERHIRGGLATQQKYKKR